MMWLLLVPAGFFMLLVAALARAKRDEHEQFLPAPDTPEERARKGGL